MPIYMNSAGHDAQSERGHTQKCIIRSNHLIQSWPFVSWVPLRSLNFCSFDMIYIVVVVVALLFYVHGKHLRSYRDGQLT